MVVSRKHGLVALGVSAFLVGTCGLAAAALSAPGSAQGLRAEARPGQADDDDDQPWNDGGDRLEQACEAPLKNGLAPATNWHFFTNCLRAVRDNWNRASGAAVGNAAGDARARVIAAMSLDDVGFRDSRRSLRGAQGFAAFFGSDGGRAAPADLQVAWLNDVGQPYNGMGQSGLAYFLFQLAASAQAGGYPRAQQDVALYRGLAAGIMRTVLLDTRAGGLDTEMPCTTLRGRSCSWYHSVSRRDRPARSGLTLNQDLHVLRDLGMMIDLHRKMGWPVPAGWEDAIGTGLNQVFQPGSRSRMGDLPTFQDYLSEPVGRDNVQWLYYGFNADKPLGSGGYFLNRNGKDCGYQVHVLDLTAQLMERAQRTRTWQPPAGAMTCASPLAQAYRATRIRMTNPDPAAWSSPMARRDTMCPAKAQETFAKVRAEFYASAFDRCG